MFDIAFLINPISGGGEGEKVFRQLGEILDSFGIVPGTWTAELTQVEGLSGQIDRMVSSSQKLIAVGGDGTIGMVLNRVRILQLKTVIGLIPLGTGNDLGRALGVYRVYNAKGLIACLKQLLKSPSRSFDLWDVNGEATLVSYISVGLDALILRDFDKARKQRNFRGGILTNKLYYLRSFFSHLGYRLPEGASVLIETLEGQMLNLPLNGRRVLLAANIDSYAAGAHPLPHARFDDGVLEIAIFTSIWKFILVAAGSRGLPILARWASRLLRSYDARSLVLSLPSGTPVQLDGEDITKGFHENPRFTVSFIGRVQLLDLRRSFYALF